MRRWLKAASKACSDLEAFIDSFDKLLIRLALLTLTIIGLYHLLYHHADVCPESTV